jgi:surface antigen
MRKRTSIFWGLALSTAITGMNPSWAMAAGNFESCISSTGNSYQCVASTGYHGTDPYNVNRFSLKAADGTLHSCTSYAAYRLYYSNPYMPAISNFDSAQYWAAEAVARVGATLNTVPKVGDIAWWDASTVPTLGHVAVVDAVTLNANGSVASIRVSDDNSGRLITTNKTLYPGINNGSIVYPQKFIRFPSIVLGGGGGGRPPVAAASPISSSDSVAP